MVQVLNQAFAFKATIRPAHNHCWDCVLSCQHSLTSHVPAEFCLLGKQKCFVKTEAGNFSWSKFSSYSWPKGSIWGRTLLPLRNFTCLSCPNHKNWERNVIARHQQCRSCYRTSAATVPNQHYWVQPLWTSCLFSVIIRWSPNLTYSLLGTKNCFDSCH